MGSEIDLLKALPKPKRNIAARAAAKDPAAIAAARLFGRLYFDGLREYGYGGYYYDGRWRPVARDIVAHYGLEKGARILDVGCAKGFLVNDLVEVNMDANGLDISDYALIHLEGFALGRCKKGTAEQLPWPDHYFDLVLSINTLHNLDEFGVIRALREIERVGKGRAFVQVDSYRTPEQKALFEDWVLTARFHDYPAGWLKVFEYAGYTGDYFWTIVE